MHSLVRRLMQPSSPQLPRDDSQRPAPKNLKKGALWFLLTLVVVAALIAFVLPKKQAKDGDTSPAHRAQSPAYDHPNPAQR